QGDLRTRPAEMTGHAVAAIQDAIARLQSGDSMQPDLDRFALVGHSMGSIISANICQRAAESNLPRPKAILVAEPAFEPLLRTYDKIPAETLLLVVVGAGVKRDDSARRILLDATRIPPE